VAAQVTLWAAKFDEAAADIFALEDALSQRVAAALALELTRGERQALTRRPTHDAEAYEFYLRGRAWLSRRVGDSIRKAAECFKGAVERDAQFALAHAGLAEAYVLISIASATLDPAPPREMAPLAIAAAERALAIDARMSEAHGILGHIRFCYDWNWPAAEAALLLALEINPANASARQYHAMALSSLGRHEEALEQIRRARALDPTSMVISTNLGFILHRAGRSAEAVEELSNCISVEPTSAYARFRFGLALEAAGRHAEALAQFDAMLALPKAEMHALVGKGHLLAVVGRRSEARDALARLMEMSKDRYVSAYYIAEVHAGLGDADEAVGWLEKAYDERPVLMMSLQTNRKFHRLRDHPRFQALVRRMGVWDGPEAPGRPAAWAR
jgi:serine/threonine-protein kinase